MNNARPPLQRRQFIKTALGATGGLASGAATSWGAKGLFPTRQRLEQAIAALEAQDEKMFLVNQAEGRFVHLLAKIIRAKTVLEVGTAHGYWTIWLAAALEATGGRVTTIEILAERIQKAKAHLARVGLDRRVTFLAGDAHKLVLALKGTYDLVFLNADKSGVLDYFQKLYPRQIKAGGALLAYGAIKRSEEMKDYLEMISRQPDFDTVTLSATLEDGFCLSVRR